MADSTPKAFLEEYFAQQQQLAAEEHFHNRRCWACGTLIIAWRRVEILAAADASTKARHLADEALRDAVAIAEEWGIDIDEAMAAATGV